MGCIHFQEVTVKIVFILFLNVVSRSKFFLYRVEFFFSERIGGQECYLELTKKGVCLVNMCI